MDYVREELMKLSEPAYADFISRLTPAVKRDLFIGVRVPALRKFAKQIINKGKKEEFLSELPHGCYEENLLHSIVLSTEKDQDSLYGRLEEFLPFVDNWAVCDTINPKALAKDRQRFLENIKIWVKSDKTYTVRFGINMLMSFFLDADFKPCYNAIPAKIKSDEYYINMMSAWYFATALAKQWDDTVVWLENKKLPVWVHNKTIQKAIESYRITDEQKSYLKTLKIKGK